jgi:hypothetical protein
MDHCCEDDVQSAYQLDEAHVGAPEANVAALPQALTKGVNCPLNIASIKLHVCQELPVLALHPI